jgi:heptaprenylglyceryl phosphate synthase
MLKKLDRSVNSQNEIYFVLKNYGHILPDPFPEDLNLYDYCGKLNSLAESYIIYENEKAVALVTQATLMTLKKKRLFFKF